MRALVQSYAFLVIPAVLMQLSIMGTTFVYLITVILICMCPATFWGNFFHITASLTGGRAGVRACVRAGKRACVCVYQNASGPTGARGAIRS